MTFSGEFRRGLGLSALVLVIDQISKWWIVTSVMRPPRIIDITPFFNLVMGWNRGVSFGMLNDSPWVSVWLLPLTTLAITGVLLVWLYRADRLWTALGVGLIIGGALGNLVDRLRFGAVIDFLDFHAFGAHWPAFNVADSGITLGAVAIILDSLFTRDEKS